MPSTRGLAAQGLPDLHESVRTQCLRASLTALPGCWGNCSTVQAAKRCEESGPGMRKWVPSQAKLGFQFMSKAPSVIVRGREKLMCCEEIGTFGTTFPWELGQPPLISPYPNAEIMEMRSSMEMRLSWRQRSFMGPDDEDVRLRTRGEAKQTEVAIYLDIRSASKGLVPQNLLPAFKIHLASISILNSNSDNKYCQSHIRWFSDAKNFIYSILKTTRVRIIFILALQRRKPKLRERYSRPHTCCSN